MIPHLEQLEDRCCPSSLTITDHGGSIIPNVAINNLYTGAAISGMDQFTQVLASQYLAMLTAPYGVGTGSFHSSTTTASPGGNISDFSPFGGLSQLQQSIVTSINAGRAPPEDGSQLYIVYLAPGETVTSPWGQLNTGAFAGYHSSFVVNGQMIPYAVIVSQNTPNDETYVVSHEVAEACTDTVPGLGWYSDQTGQEIADVYSWQEFVLAGYQVAVLCGPNGEQLTIQPPPPIPQPPGLTVQQEIVDLLAIPSEEFSYLAFRWLAQEAATFDPGLALTFTENEIAAGQSLSANPMLDTPAGIALQWVGAEAFAQAVK